MLSNWLWRTTPPTYKPAQDSATDSSMRRLFATLGIAVGVALVFLSADSAVSAARASSGEPGIIRDVRCSGRVSNCDGRFYPDRGTESREVRVVDTVAEEAPGTVVSGVFAETFYPDSVNPWVLFLGPGVRIAAAIGVIVVCWIVRRKNPKPKPSATPDVADR